MGVFHDKGRRAASWTRPEASLWDMGPARASFGAVFGQFGHRPTYTAHKNVRVSMCECLHEVIYICTYVWICIFASTRLGAILLCIRTRKYTCVSISECICSTSVCLCVCSCLCICTGIYIYIYMYMHMFCTCRRLCICIRVRVCVCIVFGRLCCYLLAGTTM